MAKEEEEEEEEEGYDDDDAIAPGGRVRPPPTLRRSTNGARIWSIIRWSIERGAGGGREVAQWKRGARFWFR